MKQRGTFVEVMLQGPTGDWAWMERMETGEVSRDQERPPEAEAACCLPTRACIGEARVLTARLRSHEGEVVMAVQLG